MFFCFLYSLRQTHTHTHRSSMYFPVSLDQLLARVRGRNRQQTVYPPRRSSRYRYRNWTGQRQFLHGHCPGVQLGRTGVSLGVLLPGNTTCPYVRITFFVNCIDFCFRRFIISFFLLLLLFLFQRIGYQGCLTQRHVNIISISYYLCFDYRQVILEI